MGTIRCKSCPGVWTVSTAKSEKVIAANHTYLHPGHRVVTVWKGPEGDVDRSALDNKGLGRFTGVALR